MQFKRITTFFVTFVLVFTTLFAPLSVPRAEAFGLFGFTFTIDVKQLAREIADGIAMVAAQRFIDQTIKDTVNWAQSGFEGNPAYAVDPKRFFLNTADQVAGQFIGSASSSLSFLCSPFQTQIRIALRNAYLQGPEQYSCTLTGVMGNIENYYNNFNQGGWDAWYTMTQTAGGNPYDAYLSAKLDLDNQIANAVGLKQEELDWNSGFLSYKKCLKYGGDSTQTTYSSEEEAWANEEAVNTCIEETTVTPGVTIKNQLDKVLPADFEKLITANHVEQIVTAFLTGVLKRYVFGRQGLFDSTAYNGSSFDVSGAGDQSSYKPNPCSIDPDIANSEYCAGQNTGAPDTSNTDGGNTTDPNAPIPTYSISGVVFKDVNGNGVYDSGDSALGGERVELTNVGQTITYAVVFTDSSGYYDMPPQAPANYRVSHLIPANYMRTTDESHIVSIVNSNVSWDFGITLDPNATI